MKKFSLEKVEWKILAAILVAIAVTFVAFFNANQGLWWDEAVHLGLAKSLYEGKGFQINNGQESFRPPMFAWLIAGTWALFGVSEVVVRIYPIIFALLSVLVVYFFARKLYNREVGLWAAAIVGTTPMLIFFGSKFLTETFFIFTSLLSILVYYIAIEKKKSFLFIPAWILLAVSFLIRYPAFLLGIVFFLYPLFARKKSDEWIKSPYFWIGIAAALFVLVPWFMINVIHFENPIGAIIAEVGTIGPEFYSGPWYFYFVHWVEIFGLIGLFAAPALLKIILRVKNSDKLIFLLLVVVLIFFAAIDRKEQRYLISFLPVFGILFALGVFEFRKWLNSKKVLVGIAIVFIALNLAGGIQMTFFDLEGGAALKDAGEFVSQKISADGRVLTQNMPVIYYMTGREVVYFPQDVRSLGKLIEEKNVEYIIIESREPTYPAYVWAFENGEKVPSEIFDKFIFEKSFEESGMTLVWIYRTF